MLDFRFFIKRTSDVDLIDDVSEPKLVVSPVNSCSSTPFKCIASSCEELRECNSSSSSVSTPRSASWPWTEFDHSHGQSGLWSCRSWRTLHRIINSGVLSTDEGDDRSPSPESWAKERSDTAVCLLFVPKSWSSLVTDLPVLTGCLRLSRKNWFTLSLARLSKFSIFFARCDRTWKLAVSVSFQCLSTLTSTLYLMPLCVKLWKL